MSSTCAVLMHKTRISAFAALVISTSARIKCRSHAADETERPPNRCDLVWQGIVKAKSFQRFVLETFRSEAAALKWLKDRGLAHYWEQAKSHEAD